MRRPVAARTWRLPFIVTVPPQNEARSALPPKNSGSSELSASSAFWLALRVATASGLAAIAGEEYTLPPVENSQSFCPVAP